MKKTVIYALTLAAAVALVLGLAVRSNPVRRTEAYFALRHGWETHWPLSSGKHLPSLVEPAFAPFVPVWMEVEPGVKMLLDPDDLVARVILYDRQYEEESWAAIKQHLPVGGTFVDVGAHIGIYSLRAAHVVGAGGRVISVEPNPETVRKLRGNIQASGASVVAVQPVACSDSEAEVELFAASRENTGETSLSRENAGQSGGATVYKVRARPLDAILAEAGVSRVDAMKIDVEGAELLVLKGARQTLTRYSPVLVMELVDKQLHSMGTSAAEVKEFLRAQGYTARRDGANIEFEK